MSQRRPITEPCSRCGAKPGEQCIDLRAYPRPGRPPTHTENLHLKGDSNA